MSHVQTKRASIEKARHLATQAIDQMLLAADLPDAVKAERRERLLNYPMLVQVARIKTCESSQLSFRPSPAC